MENSIYSSKFAFDEVVQAVGVNYAKLQSVLARHHIPLSKGALHPGRGRPREFEYADIVAIEFIVALQEMGLLLESAVTISSTVLVDAKRLAKKKEDAGRVHKIFDEHRSEERFVAFAFNPSGTAYVEQIKRSDGIEDVRGLFTKRSSQHGMELPVSITFFDMSRTIRKIDYALSSIRGYSEAARTTGAQAGRSTSLAQNMRRLLWEQGIEPLDVSTPMDKDVDD